MDATKKHAFRSGATPTVDQIQLDEITALSHQYWSPSTQGCKLKAFNGKIIEDIYRKRLLGSSFAIHNVMLLEFSQYLEKYLWPNFSSNSATDAHVLSIVAMVNEKFRERVPAWDVFLEAPEHFESFMRKVCEASLQDEGFTMKEQTMLLVFLIHCFNSLEVDLIRKQVQKFVSILMWVSILPGRREQLFAENSMYKKLWKGLQKKDTKYDEGTKARNDFDRRFLANHIDKYHRVLERIEQSSVTNNDDLNYCERFLELIIDLLSQLATRRFSNTVIDDAHVIVRSKLSKLCDAQNTKGGLYRQLLDIAKFYAGFEIDDATGEPLSSAQMRDIHYKRISELQIAAYDRFSDLKDFSMSNILNIGSRKALVKHFSPLSKDKMHEVCAYLQLLSPLEEGASTPHDDKFLLEILIYHHELRTSQLDALNDMPLYPSEEMIWDESIVPSEYFSGEGCLALPKLHLQFLTLHDYLLRNFNLFRLESTYEIRQDIEDSVTRMKPWKAEDGSCYFGGWARMSHPILSFNVVEVAKPNVDENHPARVRADVSINLNLRREIKQEWLNLRKHDVAFLITVRPVNPIGTQFDFKKDFIEQVGLVYVRGCEIEGMLDDTGKLIEEGPEPPPVLQGENRTYRVWLDPCQYQRDMTRTMNGEEDVYETFNIIMRRKPKENNFKAVLETIRDLMNTSCVVPEWLHDIILGYGDPAAARYRNMDTNFTKLDWNDTFLDIEHLKSCFNDDMVIAAPKADVKPPYKLQFTDDFSKLTVEPHVVPSRGPYPRNQPKKNTVPFTPTQTEAIQSGMQPGLTVVVGPPGTGKTDVAVQIISNLYHNFPDQRTLIVTHSNQALNQLFEKIMALDIEERHLLRLGHGEEELETDKDFSRYGRVNFVLAQRIELLEEVNRLKESLNVAGDVSYTCETAGNFYLYHILSRWEEFLSKVKLPVGKQADVNSVEALFPFSKFFANAPQPLFHQRSFEEDFSIAEGCFRYIKKVFLQLDEFRALELLRSGVDRSRYLLIKEAKIIAMTCTHAALKRRDLVELGFQYDNIMMEESAQILEIETFIPLLLQNPEHGHNRLKRWIMIGDHHQLPPVIKNMAFQKFSNMEQSLFTRFVKLGIPTIDLDAQGRSRASINNLYNWRYKKLGNLPHISKQPEYLLANAGFVHEYQLIDVQDFNGVGESAPNPYFYQNLAEAEYVVAVFMYMRLLGYSADKISILTTYNGQKHLIRDVIKQRCMDNPLIGRPHKVTTVDRFQGQQNDYILLSLVRTKTVGHLRDIRRLVVALSRARLGLYVFGRVSLFQNCHELSPAFKILTSKPTLLQLLPQENFPSNRLVDKPVPKNTRVLTMPDMPQMAKYVYDLYQEKISRFVQHKPSSQKHNLVKQLGKAAEKKNTSESMDTSDSNKEKQDGKAHEKMDTT